MRSHILAIAMLGITCLSVPAIPDKAAFATGNPAPPHITAMPGGFRYGLPPHMESKGLVFSDKSIPINRPDVKERILREINYLLLDRRSRVISWLARADALRPVMAPILKDYGIPEDFIYLAAIESSYNPRALSSAGAYGYWQFIKPTALKGPGGSDKYDWKMNINKWKDERADLVRSTHSAARYLGWLNGVKKVSLRNEQEREGFCDWFLTAAAYNAGPARVTERLNSFGANSYWDVPLPEETERYVPRWVALSLIGRHRNFYGVQIHRPGTFAFDTVDGLKLKKDLPMTEMARLLHTTPRVVWTLNSQIHPDKQVFPAKSGAATIEHRINIPRGTREKFLTQLAANGYTK